LLDLVVHIPSKTPSVLENNYCAGRTYKMSWLLDQKQK